MTQSPHHLHQKTLLYLYLMFLIINMTFEHILEGFNLSRLDMAVLSQSQVQTLTVSAPIKLDYSLFESNP